MLSSKQLQDVCLCYIGGSNQCRYLAQDEVDYRKWYCQKLIQPKKDKIDATVQKYMEECKRTGVNPYSQGSPMGDNCGGYPLLRHIEQGYDFDI